MFMMKKVPSKKSYLHSANPVNRTRYAALLSLAKSKMYGLF